MNEKDIENLDYIEIQNLNCLYRKNTTDLNCLKEVLDQKCYRSVKYDFDVKQGEHWLDLGGNIGAFGLYAMYKGATVDSYEPDTDCYEIMLANYNNNFPQFNSVAINYAITNQKQDNLVFYKGGKDSDRYRTSIIKNTKQSITLKNLHASQILETEFSGCKMDIEGAEFGLIDDELIPNCYKLVFEYHLTKDKSMKNFHRRMDILRKHFSEVLYMPSLDRFDKNSQYPGFFDRIITCKR